MVASLAVVAAVAAGGGWWLQRPGPTGSATDRSQVAAGPAAPAQRALVADAELRDQLLAMLPSGTVTDVKVEGRDDPFGQRSVEINLRLDGMQFRMYFLDHTRDPDKVRAAWSKDPGPKPAGCTATDARRYVKKLDARGDRDLTQGEMDCVSWLSRAEEYDCVRATSCAMFDRMLAYSPKKEACTHQAVPCRQLRDGSWLIAAGDLGSGPKGREDDGSRVNMANRFTVGGWDVYASSANVVDYNAAPMAVLADRPPVTVDELTAIVSSDVWFQ